MSPHLTNLLIGAAGGVVGVLLVIAVAAVVLIVSVRLPGDGT